jgi:hypothetical protein
MPWTYRIIDHGQHFALHTVDVGEDGTPRRWVSRSIDFAVDRDCGPDGLLRTLEEALAEARRHPVMREVGGKLELVE